VDNELSTTITFVNDPLAVVRPRIDFNVLLEAHKYKRASEAANIDAAIEFYINDQVTQIKTILGSDVSNSIPLNLGCVDLLSDECVYILLTYIV